MTKFHAIIMTNQQLFNAAWRGLKAQGFRQSLNSNNCVYRASNGYRCAIGQCLPNKLYHPCMDEEGGLDVRALLENFPRLRAVLGHTEERIKFLAKLQWCHDSVLLPTEMESNLRWLADDQLLHVPIED